MAWNRFQKVSVYSTLVLLLCSTVANAQETESGETVSETTTTTTETVAPRFGVDFNTPRHGDDERSFGRMTGFIPLWQIPGNNLTFLDTAVRLNSTGELGGTVTVGQRFLYKDVVLGGHLSYDVRDTGNNTFNQLGLGVEVFGDLWDIHLNGYLPIGDTQDSAGRIGGTGQVTETQFQGNQLVFFTEGGTEFLESAWGGVDLDAGMQLADWDSWGQLWGYGGVYYHGDAIGGRLRVDHRVQEWMRLGLGVQSDDNFGTRGFFSIGLSWGGDSYGSADDGAVWLRAAESVTRNSSIVVKESEVVTAGGTEVAINPATGQAYNFQHVTPDSTSTAGDGTIENPAANVNLVNAQAGDIIYVREGDSRTNPLAPFTVPADVVAISDANLETIATQAGNITLPGSGTGILPLVNATGSDVGITLTGGNNRLSGFEIVGAADTNIFVDGSNNALIDNNFSRDDLDDGIEVINSSNVTLARNTIIGSGDDAIDIESSDGTVISGNRISGSTDDGVEIIDSGDVTVNNNTIINSGDDGIVLESSASALIQNNTLTNNLGLGMGVFGSAGVTVGENTIDGGDFGIAVVESDNALIQNNLITDAALVSIEIAGADDVTVADNSISASGEFGIFIDTSDSTLVQNNRITESTFSGIELIFSTNASLVGNIISDSGSGAIVVFDSNTITIQDNQVTDTATDITADLVAGAIFLEEVVGTVEISDNRVTDTTGTNEFDGQGIALINSRGDVDLDIDSNIVSNNQGDGIVVTLADVTPRVGDGTADITITNNIIEDNGATAPLRGDGIKIVVEEDGAIDDLLIEENILIGNFDDGIDISLGLAETSNTPNIDVSNAQVLDAIVRNNSVTNSQNGNGILLRSFGNNSRLVILVDDNTLEDNSAVGLVATSLDTDADGSTRLCLDLTDNDSDNGYSLNETLGSTFTVVDLGAVDGDNMGTVSFDPLPANLNFGDVTRLADCP